MAERGRSSLWARAMPILENVGSSYWFVPGFMSALSVALAFVTLEVDQAYGDALRLPVLRWGTASGVRAVLETIATSMITVAGVVFSITIVALSLASRQYGPMLLRNFMEDRPNQVVLGTFVSTYLYCVLVMRAVRGDEVDGGASVPQISTTVALALALASLAVLIFFIHHIARSIRVESVLSRIAEMLDREAERLYPAEMGRGPDAGRTEGLPGDFDERTARVPAPHDGYVHGFEEERLLSTARERDLLVELSVAPNDFVVRGCLLFRVYPAERCTRELLDDLGEMVVLGADPSPMGDVRYGIDQLVQLALRALSPSLNDPLTAMAVIDRLLAIQGHVARKGVPSRYRYDGGGRLRLVARRPSFEDLIHRAFDPVRINVGRQTAVARHLLEGLAKLAPSLGPAHRRDVHAFAVRLGETSRTDLLPGDWASLEPLHRRVLAALAREPVEVSGVRVRPEARADRDRDEGGRG